MRKGMSRSMLAVVTVAVAIVAFLGGLGVGAVYLAAPPAPEKPVMVVGTNTPFKPMEYRDEQGNLVGFDVDLFNEIGRRAGWEVVWRDFQDWDALLAAIKFRGVDVGVSSITSNLPGEGGAERNASFDFSESYYEADQGVLVKAGSTAVTCAAAECTPEELANHTVAVQTLTTSYWWIIGSLVDTAMTPESMVHDFGDVSVVIQELINGAVDWVLVDKPVAEGLVASNTNLHLAGTIETNELYAFAVPDGDPGHLLPTINAKLAEMKQDGKFDEIFNTWFSA
jgi:polar amino acid transport system substrate-binding protein